MRKTALVLRTCNADFTSHKGFQWPNEVGAVVTCPDWNPVAECGNGLHGWLYGAGYSSASNSIGASDAKWLVVEVALDDIVNLDGKVKFPRCVIRHIGDKATATQYLYANEPEARGLPVIGLTLTAGDHAKLTAGDHATLTAGDCATLTAGYGATLTAGYGATLTAGYGATLTAGYGATLTAGDHATLTAGYGATLTAGDCATLTAGDHATLTAGDGATLTAGNKSELRLRYWDDAAERYRTASAYVGENGIKPGVAYKLDDNHQFVEA